MRNHCWNKNKADNINSLRTTAQGGVADLTARPKGEKRLCSPYSVAKEVSVLEVFFFNQIVTSLIFVDAA